jgi:diguanylate cyclase (GGDEF)-like protein
MKRIVEAVLSSYFELVQSLVKGCTALQVVDAELEPCGARGVAPTEGLRDWLRKSNFSATAAASPDLARTDPGGGVEVALALLDSANNLLAAVGITVTAEGTLALGTAPARALRQRLKPVLDCLHREIGSAVRTKAKTATLTERTRDLEWLFDVANELKSAASNERALQHLLSTACERMRCSYSALLVPGQKLTLQHTRSSSQSDTPFSQIRTQAQAQIMAWVGRHHQPLILNQVGTKSTTIARSKLIAVPVLPRQGKALGALIFLNAPDARDFVKRQAFLAAHIARHIATLLQSQYDLATGLLTRTALESTYESLPPQARQGAQAVLYVDIDKLHVINNVHGYSIGDDVIVSIANLLTAPAIPRDSLIARISGDQFVIILHDGGTQGAERVAAQLQQNSSRVLVKSAAGGVEITLSCGIGALRNEPGGFRQGLLAAETACQAAKDRGRNRIETFACDDSSLIQRQGDSFMYGTIRDALRSDQFELFAQPIVPLRNLELSGGYEVLLRLRKPDSTVSGPADFLSAAERYQLMPSIDQWVMENTIKQLEPYVSVLLHRRLSVSVNVTAHSLTDDKFVDFLIARLRSSRVPPGLLTVEITEQTALRNLPFAARLMHRLRELGCGVALDDFGTGNNSLVCLRDLPVTRVKIDGSFVRDILGNPRSEGTLRGILQLLEPFKVETVAEYVENEAIAQRLRRLKVDYAQGYAFGKPEPMQQLLHNLKLDESQRLRKLALEL